MNTNPAVDRVVSRVQRELRRCGVPADRRELFAGDLTSDLRAAAARGRSPEEALGMDPAAMARDWARESGFNATPLRYGIVVSAVIVPLALTACLGYFISGGSQAIGLPYYAVASLEGDLSLEIGFALLGLLGLLGVMAALAAPALVLGALDDDRAARTVRVLALSVPLGCMLAIPAAMLGAFLAGYQTDAAGLAAVTAAGAAPVTVAAVLARRRALGPSEAEPL